MITTQKIGLECYVGSIVSFASLTIRLFSMCFAAVQPEPEVAAVPHTWLFPREVRWLYGLREDCDVGDERIPRAPPPSHVGASNCVTLVVDPIVIPFLTTSI